MGNAKAFERKTSPESRISNAKDKALSILLTGFFRELILGNHMNVTNIPVDVIGICAQYARKQWNELFENTDWDQTRYTDPNIIRFIGAHGHQNGVKWIKKNPHNKFGQRVYSHLCADDDGIHRWTVRLDKVKQSAGLLIGVVEIRPTYAGIPWTVSREYWFGPQNGKKAVLLRMDRINTWGSDHETKTEVSTSFAWKSGDVITITLNLGITLQFSRKGKEIASLPVQQRLQVDSWSTYKLAVSGKGAGNQISLLSHNVLER